MGPCVMIGDSIAVGVGMNRPECETIAQVGINSERFVTTMMPAGTMTVDTAVISLGVNDDASLDTLTNLREVRGRIAGRTVFWLLPGLKPSVREMIQTVAAEYGDRLIDTRPEVGRDHLHPTGTGYQRIAARTVGNGDPGDEEVAFDEPRVPRAYGGHINARGHLTGYATPSERIRRMRAMRRGESLSRVSHVSQLHREARALRTTSIVAVAPHGGGERPPRGRRSATATCARHGCLVRSASARS